MWLLLPHSMSINRGKKQGHQIHSAYDIALFQQSLHSFIHPPTNKSLDLNKWRWRRRLRVKERGLERQSHLLRGCAPFYLVWWLTLLLMGRFLSLLWCFTIFSSSQCAFGGEAPDWLWLARGGEGGVSMARTESARVRCVWAPELVSRWHGWGAGPAGGDDADGGRRLLRGERADWRRPPLPLPQQRPEDSAGGRRLMLWWDPIWR